VGKTSKSKASQAWEPRRLLVMLLEVESLTHCEAFKAIEIQLTLKRSELGLAEPAGECR
jgi:hypothetical protein